MLTLEEKWELAGQAARDNRGLQSFVVARGIECLQRLGDRLPLSAVEWSELDRIVEQLEQLEDS